MRMTVDVWVRRGLTRGSCLGEERVNSWFLCDICTSGVISCDCVCFGYSWLIYSSVFVWSPLMECLE